MNNSEGAFSVLRQSSDLACASAIEEAVREATDRDVQRMVGEQKLRTACEGSEK